MSDTATPLLIGLAVLVGFPAVLGGMFAAVSTLLSAVGGWRRLARRYRAEVPAGGWTWTMQSGMVGLVSYRNVLSIASRSDGLHLGVFALFRFGHPPLFLPWTAMRDPRPRRLLWWDLVAVEVEADRPVRLALPARVFPPGFAEGSAVRVADRRPGLG